MSTKNKNILLHLGIALGIAIAAFCLMFFLQKRYDLQGWCDALAVAAVVVLCIAGFAFVGRSGSFDVLGFGMARFLDQWRHKDSKKYANAGDYQLAMKEKRQTHRFPYVSYLSVGGALLVAALVLLILVETHIN